MEQNTLNNTANGHNSDVSHGDLTNAIVNASNKIQLGEDNVTELQINVAIIWASPPALNLPPTTNETSERGRMKVDYLAMSLYI